MATLQNSWLLLEAVVQRLGEAVIDLLNFPRENSLGDERSRIRQLERTTINRTTRSILKPEEPLESALTA